MKPRAAVALVLLSTTLLAAACRGRVPLTSATGTATAVITGELGYPSEWVPPMTVYAEDPRSGEVFFARTNSSPSVTGYALEVRAPGTYRVFAWTAAGASTEESIGSYYCGGSARECSTPADQRVLTLSVAPGDTVRGIDIFLFGGLPERVPRPPST